MKKIFIFGFLVLTMFFVQISSTFAYVNVSGYYRKNGTYVAPHVRSNPNGLKYDNYSYKPIQGLYNPSFGTRGSTWDTPTYITDPDYYLGKSLYEQGKTGLTTSIYGSNYTYPAIIKNSLSTRSISYSAKNWADSNPTTPCVQSTFLRTKEKGECEIYKQNKNNYQWEITTKEFDGKYYRYDNITKMSYSCSDGYYLSGNSCFPETKVSNPSLLPLGCSTSAGFSPVTGRSCTPQIVTCGAGLQWNGTQCTSQ